MNNFRFNINDKEINSKHTGINCNYFWFCEISKICHKENEHVKTHISKYKVNVLWINELRDFWCVISFSLDIWIILRRYTLNFVKFVTEKDGKFILTISIKNHAWFAFNFSSNVCKRLLNDVIGLYIEKNSNYRRN